MKKEYIAPDIEIEGLQVAAYCSGGCADIGIGGGGATGETFIAEMGCSPSEEDGTPSVCYNGPTGQS